MGVPEGEKREKGTKRVFEEIMAQNLPNFMKDIDLHIQEAQQTQSRIKQKDPHFDTS